MGVDAKAYVGSENSSGGFKGRSDPGFGGQAGLFQTGISSGRASDEGLHAAITQPAHTSPAGRQFPQRCPSLAAFPGNQPTR